MPTIQIAQYRGKSLISRLIEWQTRSVYSHSAAIMPDGSVIEAWHKGGVSHVSGLYVNHTPWTVIDVYEVSCTKDQHDIFYAFLLEQVGKPYDFKMVFRFLSHQPARLNDKWFCSELVTMGLKHANINIFASSVCASDVSPGLLVWSPVIKYKKTIMRD